MRAEDLDHKELLELDPDGGVIRFAGQRALLLDAVAMGLLRKYLVENFGLTAARTVLTQFGFAHGWRMAEAMQAQFTWDSDDEWQRAGTRIHALEGLFRVEPGPGPQSKAGSIVVASYEVEQHLLHFGRSDIPVCWTICGLTSGYLSRISGKEMFVLEDRCLGKGDAACQLFARSREAWGDERAEELRFFEPTRLQECLDVSLLRVTRTLKAAERKLQGRRRALVSVAPDIEDPLGMVVKSAAMRRLVDLAHRIARVDSTVLITGESGAGKERIARLVHDESTRAAGPFIAVNCGAITETLLESELFGHARGAFTGATQDRPGLFEAASNGTLLLDEVGEVSPSMQVKLLRALQEREIRRVGALPTAIRDDPTDSRSQPTAPLRGWIDRCTGLRHGRPHGSRPSREIRLKETSMSISYGDKAVTTLRTLVAKIESELASATPAEALRAAWTEMVEILALGPPPELRQCATCGNSGLRAATRCMYCWSSLPLLSPSHAVAADPQPLPD